MTLDEMISVFKNGDLQDIDYELIINSEQLLYWLTEYKAMTSGRQSDNLSERLASHLVWAESNSYERPITLAEDLQETIRALNHDENAIVFLNERIEEMENDLNFLQSKINRLQSENSWISCSERMPDEDSYKWAVGITSTGRCIAFQEHNAYENDTGGISVPTYLAHGSEITHWMPTPEPPKEVEE